MYSLSHTSQLNDATCRNYLLTGGFKLTSDMFAYLPIGHGDFAVEIYGDGACSENLQKSRKGVYLPFGKIAET